MVPAGLIPDVFEGLVRRAHAGNAVSQFFQHQAPQLHQRTFIIHEKDVLLPAVDVGFRLQLLRDRLGRYWEKDFERGAFARRAVHTDFTPQAFHDAVYDGQPQTGAFVFFLGGEIGIENARHGFRAHPGTRVADAQLQVANRLRPATGAVFRSPIFERSEPDIENTAPRLHGVQGVGAEIHDDLVDLGRIG